VCVCQYVGMYVNEEFGGMEGTLDRLITADPDFGEVLFCYSHTRHNTSIPGCNNNNYTASATHFLGFLGCKNATISSKDSIIAAMVWKLKCARSSLVPSLSFFPLLHFFFLVFFSCHFHSVFSLSFFVLSHLLLHNLLVTQDFV